MRNPLPRFFYELCDSMGFYVYSEANLETHELRPFPDGAPEWDGAVMDRIVALHARDKNHASVLWWSLGQTVVLVCTGLWQMRHLKGFFEAKKLV